MDNPNHIAVIARELDLTEDDVAYAATRYAEKSGLEQTFADVHRGIPYTVLTPDAAVTVRGWLGPLCEWDEALAEHLAAGCTSSHDLPDVSDPDGYNLAIPRPKGAPRTVNAYRTAAWPRVLNRAEWFVMIGPSI